MRDRYNKLIHSGFVVDFLISYVTFLYRLGESMPVFNSFCSLCKFADRAMMHHKGNYIAAEGMSIG